MLVARRDPFHHGPQDGSFSERGGAAASHAGGAAPRLTRAMGVVQIVGTLLAIPVGIGSAYSMYRANFSVDSTCQSLRGNIIVMLDKSVDASTRHMLVRRDVEAFERTCGVVDPDATAAFKALLATDKAAAPVSAATLRHAEPRPESVVRKVEPRPDVAAKDLAAKEPAANTSAVTTDTEPVHRDASASDAVWLAAVRRALVTHVADPVPSGDATKTTAATQALTPVRPILREIHAVSDAAIQPATLVAPAPALPPATSVAPARGPQSDADHPVPPAPIPEMTPANTAKADAHSRSRLGELVAQIPIVGWAFDR